jgi:parallel beta-helix repeat protein
MPSAAKPERTSVPGVYRVGNRYVVRFRDPSGRCRKRSCRTLAEARAVKAELKTDMDRGEWRSVASARFDEYPRFWIESYGGRTSRGVRDVTRDDYRRALGLTTGSGIELDAGSLGNDLLSNIAGNTSANGIYIAGAALGAPGNLLERNTTSGNGGNGIHVAKGGHTISGNTANSNGKWGIFAEGGNTDGGGNTAAGNGKAAQCFGVAC